MVCWLTVPSRAQAPSFVLSYIQHWLLSSRSPHGSVWLLELQLSYLLSKLATEGGSMERGKKYLPAKTISATFFKVPHISTQHLIGQNFIT